MKLLNSINFLFKNSYFRRKPILNISKPKIVNFKNNFEFLQKNKFLLIANIHKKEKLLMIGERAMKLQDTLKRADNELNSSYNLLSHQIFKDLKLHKDFFLNLVTKTELSSYLCKIFDNRFILIKHNLDYIRGIKNNPNSGTLLPYHCDGKMYDQEIIKIWTPLYGNKLGIDTPSLQFIPDTNNIDFKIEVNPSSESYGNLELDHEIIKESKKKFGEIIINCEVGDVFLFFGNIPHRSYVTDKMKYRRNSVEMVVTKHTKKISKYLKDSNLDYYLIDKKKIKLYSFSKNINH